MNNDIEQRIQGLKASIQSLQEGLPYADHGAYSQDKDRIARMLAEIRQLRAQQEAENAGTD